MREFLLDFENKLPHLYCLWLSADTVLEITSWKITLRLIPGGFLIIGRESRTTLNNEQSRDTVNIGHKTQHRKLKR